MITDWNRIDALVDKLAPEMIAVRHHLHAHPEPSGAERQTAQFLAERLRADGLEVRSVADDRGLLVAPPRAREKVSGLLCRKPRSGNCFRCGVPGSWC